MTVMAGWWRQTGWGGNDGVEGATQSVIKRGGTAGKEWQFNNQLVQERWWRNERGGDATRETVARQERGGGGTARGDMGSTTKGDTARQQVILIESEPNGEIKLSLFKLSILLFEIIYVLPLPLQHPSRVGVMPSVAVRLASAFFFVVVFLLFTFLWQYHRYQLLHLHMNVCQIPVKLDRISFRSATEVGFQPVEKAEQNIRDIAAGFRRNPAGTGILPWTPAPRKTGTKTGMCHLGGMMLVCY
jgi:hypothetical protein